MGREREAAVIIMRDGGCVGVQGGERCQVSHLHMYGRRGGGWRRGGGAKGRSREETGTVL